MSLVARNARIAHRDKACLVSMGNTENKPQNPFRNGK